MFVKQQTWIENGPGPVRPRYRRRGMGAVADCSLSAFFSPSVKTSDLIANCFTAGGETISGAFSDPLPASSLPLPPNPNAPQTLPDMVGGGYTVDDSYNTPSDWAAWRSAQVAAINTHDTSLASFMSKYGSLLFFGGLALGGMAIYNTVRR